MDINFNMRIGKIKPMHGIGNAPLMGTDNRLFKYLGEAGIPYSRLHDTGGRYGGGVYVDIANIFRNFDLDPSEPESYDFAFTDWLLSELHKQNIKPFYRLGATIENSHFIKAYNIYPPKDNTKWAKICEGIIRHYNEGWANGFKYNIEYWEIWNEPDNEPDIKDNPMWKGTKEEFFKLYEVTSNHLKKLFPSLKIGGYASCGFYALTNTDVSHIANSSPRLDYFITFFNEFLEYITSEEHKSPLDFFSWHSYSGPRENKMYAGYVQKKLDEYGLTTTESILNEWNPGIANRGTPKDAAMIAAMMCTMQNTSVDSCMYYDGQVDTSYGGMFDPVKHTVFKAYYAFKAFNELYVLKNQGYIKNEDDRLYAICAADDNKYAVLIANPHNEDISVCYSVNTEICPKVYIIDETHDLTEAELNIENELVIGANTVMLIKY